MVHEKLSAREGERYHRQIIIPSWGEKGQQVVRDSCVFVAGAGGLGSPVSIYLAAAGIGHMRICDHGEVELSNLNRQVLHGEKSIGEKKVLSAAKTLESVNPSVRITPLEQTITAETIGSLVGEASLIVDCLDNFQTRYILNEHAVKRGLPLVHAGVNGYCGQITFIHPPNTGCLSCLVSEAPPAEVFPILGATAGAVGCLQAMEVLKYLSASGEMLQGRLLFFDGQAMEFQEVTFDKDPQCRICGRSNA